MSRAKMILFIAVSAMNITFIGLQFGWFACLQVFQAVVFGWCAGFTACDLMNKERP